MRRLTRRRFWLLAGVLPVARLSAAEHPQVIIKRFGFEPAELTIPVGTSVRWTNLDPAPHTATDRSERWDTGELARNADGVIRFDQVGTFEYFCRFHPNMTGQIIVTG